MLKLLWIFLYFSKEDKFVETDLGASGWTSPMRFTDIKSAVLLGDAPSLKRTLFLHKNYFSTSTLILSLYNVTYYARKVSYASSVTRGSLTFAPIPTSCYFLFVLLRPAESSAASPHSLLCSAHVTQTRVVSRRYSMIQITTPSN